MRRFGPLAVAVALALPGSALAQDDGGFLERSLEDALSGEGRDVAISGFQGALSSEARIAEITFSDADGIWLRIADVTLSWTRSALLRGSVDVERLTAAEIELIRPPAPANEAPAAEASGFSLPDLPVSIEIGTLAANRLILGEALFGQAAELSLDATLSLAGGEGSGQIKADRLDGQDGAFLIEGSFNNADRVLTLAAMLAEAEDGIVATLAGLPDTPSLDLNLSGTGPLNDFAADLTLATNGADRLQGALTLSEAPDAPGTTEFNADVGGDIAPLLFPDYQAFFGPDLTLEANGRRAADGALSLSLIHI